MSSFRGADLFGSGPHRFAVGERGQALVPLSVLFDNPALAGRQAVGDLELQVVVAGRLVAETESALWVLREAIAAASAQALGTGTLVDSAGRSLEGMRLVSFEEDDRVDRGRVWSVGYRCVFWRVSG